ncbi:hypothetical protein NE237_005107 [Protea cynaroides]|uniref:TIR domain-containing protein n=1 Tax=Protea cynaroides TaxID=273540 RepID=A0A9Q0KJZ1_9MAGN|nr:hypothetical protein NE237_005107 [Protea cynaroides]
MYTSLLIGGIFILLVLKLFHRRTAKEKSNPASYATQDSDSSSSSFPSCGNECDSSSSSFPHVGCEYEVFLSFKGDDTRTNFTDHLYHALLDHGIRTFRDNEEFQIGKKMNPVLWSAIRRSKIAIPIFSKNYGSSEWCLRELAEMVECMKQKCQRQITVMPLFYNVNPWYVKFQAASYMEPLLKCEKFSCQETEGWKKALEEVGSLYGWELKKIANGHEGELVRLIVKDVCSELKKSSSIVSRVKPLFDRVTAVTAMGKSDSASSATQDCDYDVFLSCRGEDSSNFTDHLYNALLNCGFHTFRGNEGAQVGQNIEPADRYVIHQSKIAIPIFCKDYASSEWCLRELDEIVKCRKQRDQRQITVIPVFYHVDPSDVQNQTGSYMNAFQNHQKEFSGETKGWKKALNKVGKLKEWDLKTMANGNDLALIYNIVKVVKSELRKSPLTDSANQLVGIDSQVEKMMKLLKIESNDTRTVAGIHGKTYEPHPMDFNEDLQLFSKHAFKRDQPPEHFLDLSQEVVKTIGTHPLALEVIGASLFCQKKPAWKDMVDKLKNIQNDEVQKKLKDSPNEELQKKLKDIPNEELQKKLRISYDGLSCVQKEIFLDIACFFIGMDKNIVCYRWDENLFPKIGIKVLRRKLLIEIDENNELRMHDQLRDLGRKIVNQENTKMPGKGSRLWLEQDILDALKTQTGPMKVEVLCLKVISPNLMHSFSELRWLSLRGCDDTSVIPTNLPKLAVLDLSFSNITKSWPGWSYIKFVKTLKVLDLKHCVKLSRTPNLSENLELEVLLLQGCVKLKAFDQSIDNLKRLVILNMERCRKLKYLPPNIYRLSSLKRLNIRSTGINQLPDNLHCLKALTELLIDETSIEKLPDSMGNLTNLKTLSAGGCKIQKGGIPDDIWRLSSLESLILNGNQIPSLPETVSSFCLLQTLSLAKCTELQSLPELPSSLKSLDASGCAIKSLPCLSNLTNLEKLCLDNCQNLVNIPNLPSGLRSMTATGCGSVTEISGFSDMRNLVTLCFDECNSLERTENIKGLNSLPILEIRNCGLLGKMPNLQSSKKLMSLKFFKVGISGIEDLEALDSLDRLNIRHCNSLIKIRLPVKLRILYIDICKMLSEIRGLEVLESLEEITIRYSPSALPLVSIWKNLKYLDLYKCDYMEVPSVDRLESLEVLKIFKCKSMKILSDLSNVTKLRELRIEHCEGLNKIQGSDRLEILEVLIINGCISIETLPCLSKLKKLRILSAVKCRKLTEIQGVEELQSLEELNINECISIETLPCLSKLKKLMILSAVNCRKLTGIQGAEELESLKLLKISKCISIETLCLAKLKNLKRVLAVKCMNLTEIQGLDGLKSLNKLDVRGCFSLKLSDPSSLRRSMRFVDINSDDSSNEVLSDLESDDDPLDI